MKRNILHKTILLFLCFIFQSCNFITNGTTIHTEIQNDSIAQWIKSSKNTSFPIAKRKLFLRKAHNGLKLHETDSVASVLSTVAYQYLNLKDTANFKKINKEAWQLALKIKDTFTLADTHWNTANFYKKREVYDSAYYHYNKAYHYFENLDEQYFAAKMLYGMAFIKGRFKDYSGSEILIVKAISKYKVLKKNKALFASYNLLAIIQDDIGEYDRALFYHEKAMEYLDKLKNKNDYYETSLNNIGTVYLKKGQYQKAMEYFNKVLADDSLQMKDIGGYARVIDNKAYCRLLDNDTMGVKKALYQSLKIRDSIHNKAGIVISKIHLAEYYGITQDTLRAIIYGKEANLLAKTIENSRDYLASLQLLAKLDKNRANNYLNRYLTFNDSLQIVDRKTQNKFTRIAYETDEYIKETKRLSQQRIWILVTASATLLILSLLYFLKIQKSKNEKLLLEIEQQKANEQLYILTLRQQARFEEERTKERNRISEELHDGILGKLFGTRVRLGFLDIQGDDNIIEQHELFLKELQEIEREIREVSHKLNNNSNTKKIDFGIMLDELLKNKSALGHFQYQLKITENLDWETIHEISKVNLYRIAQEALQNIIKYASANNVFLDFSTKDRYLVVSIKDDGVGFNTKKIKKGIGLKNMRSRIQKLKGSFSIRSEIDKGTIINFTIPIQ